MNELRQLMFNPAFWFGAFVSLVISIIAGIIVVYGQDRFTKRAAIRQAALEKHIKELEQHTETIVSSHAIMQVQALTLYYIESIRKLVALLLLLVSETLSVAWGIFCITVVQWLVPSMWPVSVVIAFVTVLFASWSGLNFKNSIKSIRGTQEVIEVLSRKMTEKAAKQPVPANTNGADALKAKK